MIISHFVKPKVRGGARKLRPVVPTRRDEVAYKSDLLRLVRALVAAVDTHVVKAGHVRGYAADGALQDAMQAVRSATVGVVVVAEAMARKHVKRVQGTVDKNLAANVKNSIGIDITSAFTNSVALQSAYATAVAANVDLIKSIATTYLGKVQELVEGNLRQGLRYESLIGEIQRIGKVTESRAKLIARDQTSKMNSSFNEVRQTQLGITEYVWRTSGDERVRPEHADNNNKVFRWADAPSNTGHPGHDIQCRCVAIPVIT